MDVEISLQDYLDQVKKQFSLDESMSYNNVVKVLQKEVNFRESLIESMKLKLYGIRHLLGNKNKSSFLENLKISDLDRFNLKFNLDGIKDILFFKELVDLKLHYIFNVMFYSEFGKLTMDITLNEIKLNEIKRYI